MGLEAKHLTKVYSGQCSLDHVSFTVGAGQTVGLLGPNGAGKSTLMKILTGIIPPSSGSAAIEGFDIEKEPIEAKKNIGYLPENNPLPLDMYVREYLGGVCELKGAQKKELERLITLTALENEAHKKIGELSKGYRQRVGLAATLAGDPRILILDEPTSGLDPNQLIEIREIIRNIGSERIVVLSTHIMQEVEAMCSRAIILHRGKIVADVSLDELRDKNRQVLLVEFDLRIEPRFLQGLPGLLDAENFHDTQWRLVFGADMDMRGTIFDFAEQNGLKILGMNRENKSLEEFFASLTSPS